MPTLPDVILHFDFLTSGNPDWSIKGENNCENDYSDYCSREEAFLNKNLKIAKYDYYDYTGDEEKTDGNFDINNDILTPDQEEKYRQLEIQSKQNGCIKYLGFMSFHNNFLEDNKIIDNGILDSQKLKKVVRSAMSELLNTSKKLDIENTYWTAAIHINTDNVHAHITLLEKEKRERKNDCIEQYAIEAFKSKVVNTIAGSERSQLITEISRNVLLPGIHNKLGKVNFNELISQLPERHELWFYNRREFKPYKKYVDDCVNKIIEDTPGLKEEFDGFIQQLDRYTESYKKNYGEGQQELYKEYKKNKLQDFYSRAGNSILKELKNFSENPCVLSEKETDVFEAMETSEIIKSKIDIIDISEQIHSADNMSNSSVLSEKEKSLVDFHQITFNEIENYTDELDSIIVDDLKIEWTDTYKLAKQYMSGTKKIEKDHNNALKLMSLEAFKGNVLAMHDIGYMYLKNLIDIDIDDSKQLSNEFFENAFKGFKYIYANGKNEKMQEYLSYRIGKMYSYGYGTEQDYTQAFEYFLKAENNKYAQFSLGSIYEYGNGVEKDFEKAFKYYRQSADQDNAFAQFKTAEFLQQGKIAKIDLKLADSYYEKAFNNFLLIDEDNPDHNIKYKIGYMYYNGYGTMQDIEIAKEYFRKSLKENDKSKYMLAKIYLSEENSTEDEKMQAVSWLTELSEKENSLAQYTLGKMYLSGEVVDQDKSMAMKYLTMSAELNNEYAQYTLGKMYLTGEVIDQDKTIAIKYLTATAEQNNEYAQYTLGNFFLSDREYIDIEKALSWLKRSANDNNNQFAQYTLGKIYLTGELTPQNKSLAILYLTASAEQNNEFAQYTLGKLLLNDEKYKNIPEALSWLKKSADENNNQYAQYTLGKFYIKDKENKDIELGKSYLQKSADQGNENAQKYLDRLGGIRSRRRYLQEQRKQQKAFYDYTLQKIVNQLEGHLEKLKNEFNSEEDSKLAQEQHELEIQIENERSW